MNSDVCNQEYPEDGCCDETRTMSDDLNLYSAPFNVAAVDVNLVNTKLLLPNSQNKADVNSLTAINVLLAKLLELVRLSFYHIHR